MAHRDSCSITADAENANENIIVVAAKYGFAKFDRTTGQIEYLKRVWEGTSDIERADKSVDTTLSCDICTHIVRGCVSTTAQ